MSENRLVRHKQQSLLESQNWNGPGLLQFWKQTHGRIQAGVLLCPQANKCKLCNHVGTDQRFYTHARRLHYFNFHPRRIIATLLQQHVFAYYFLFFLFPGTHAYPRGKQEILLREKKEELFNKKGLMFIFKSAVAFIRTEKQALNSDIEKGKWKGHDSPATVNTDRFPWCEKKQCRP